METIIKLSVWAVYIVAVVAFAACKKDDDFTNPNITGKLVTENARVSARERHVSLVFDNKIWVIGGFDGSYKNDVWYLE